jgi:hypothetical protein
MTNTKKLWKDMMDYEKGALLLAHHDGAVIECSIDNGVWFYSDPQWNAAHAYRIKPKAPKVETEVEYFTYFPGDGLCFAYIEDASITITYTITDGIVTACDTIIHKNGE